MDRRVAGLPRLARPPQHGSTALAMHHVATTHARHYIRTPFNLYAHALSVRLSHGGARITEVERQGRSVGVDKRLRNPDHAGLHYGACAQRLQINGIDGRVGRHNDDVVVKT